MGSSPDSAPTDPSSPDAAEPGDGDRDAPTALYASPIRAGLLGLFLLVFGLGIASLPFLQLAGGTFRANAITAFMAFVFVAFGLLVAYPGFQFLKLVATATPFITTDGTVVRRTRLGLGQTEIAWKDVGEFGLRGIWIILVDGRIKQGRVIRSIMGTRGLWLPAMLVEGGGSRTMQFASAHRPDLVDPLMAKVLSRGARW